MQKILFIIDALSSGAGRVLHDLVKNLDKKRFEAVIVSIYRGGGLVEDFEKLKARMINLNKGEGVGLNTILRIRKIILKEKPDIVHAHNVDAYEYGILAASLAGVKNIVHTAHGKSIKRGKIRRIRENIFHKFVSLFLDHYAVVSKDLGRYAAKNWCLNKRKIKTIYNGIDYGKYKKIKVSKGFLCKLGVDKKDLLIGIIAGLRPVKNHPMLIKAMEIVEAEIPNAKLLVIGDGPEKKRLKNLVSELGLRNVLFLGNRTDIDKLLNCLDVNVLCSFSECLSVTLLEAMACEVPCVATDVGGNNELIDDGTGFLVLSKNPELLAEKITALLRDEKLRLEIGKKAREKVVKKFGIDKKVKEYENIY